MASGRTDLEERRKPNRREEDDDEALLHLTVWATENGGHLFFCLITKLFSYHFATFACARCCLFYYYFICSLLPKYQFS